MHRMILRFQLESKMHSAVVLWILVIVFVQISKHPWSTVIHSSAKCLLLWLKGLDLWNTSALCDWGSILETVYIKCSMMYHHKMTLSMLKNVILNSLFTFFSLPPAICVYLFIKTVENDISVLYLVGIPNLGIVCKTPYWLSCVRTASHH